MRVLSLFSGIGGLDLGLERAGMTVVGQVEIDPFCRAVLAKHWPGVPQHDDVRTREYHKGEADVVAGGFPCQDVSNAGECAGISAERSGLYRELVRAVRVVRPLYAIMENVAALLIRGMGTVLGDLAEVGYDAEWDCLPACAVGARSIRDRVFIMGHPASVDDSDSIGKGCFFGQEEEVRGWVQNPTERPRCGWGAWASEPPVGRVAYGIPRSVDRVCACGNAVVPQVAEVIGTAIMESPHA